ncbi:6-bladed beta-propeller [Litoribacter alkaliphilus]|uniref:6-bladed beta-propeller n=1 Tax=Litoribacter ruber TaxID=702568 RepID=A0AAP2CKV7_9BACT|nr:6-bladed beta-propeller [Litoribacter alkaliphilus]MBS9525790.1 6-bladed beta-propeller [Litoribacter alkaliphilus]
MRNIKLSLFIFLVFLLQNCGDKDISDVQVSKKTIEIQRDFLLSDSPELQIEILDTINLEATENPPISAIQDMVFAQNFFLLLDRKQGLLKFDNQGNLLRKIGKMGEGPDEYIMPYAIHLKENIVLVADWQKRIVISYDLEGDLSFSSQKLQGHPISFYENDDSLSVIQETINGNKEKPRQVLVSLIEPKTLEVKQWEKPLYGYNSNYTIIHPIPRILSRVNNVDLFYKPIIRGDISSHNATDTIFKKEGDQLVPEYTLQFTGFDNSHQLGINHVVMYNSFVYLRVGYDNRSYHVIIDLENQHPIIHLRQLFNRDLTEEIIPKPLDGDVFYSILRNESGTEEKNPLILLYRLTSSHN